VIAAAVGLLGWIVAVALAVVVARLRRRLELVARAEHELRGPLTAFTLALDAARGTPSGRRLGAVLDAELARARAGLADLSEARRGRRAAAMPEEVRVDRLTRSSAAAWDSAARADGRRVRVRFEAGEAVVHGDRRRLAQALGNVMANAVEHGEGDVSVSGSRTRDRVRIEVTNATRVGAAAAGSSGRGRGRGRGLAIAGDAAVDAGGTLTAGVGERRAVSILDLPVEP
jgi:signal transduction histidine kinase